MDILLIHVLLKILFSVIFVVNYNETFVTNEGVYKITFKIFGQKSKVKCERSMVYNVLIWMIDWVNLCLEQNILQIIVIMK